MPPEKKIHPYGLWPSPINASMLARRSRIEDVQWLPDGSGLVWLENRSGLNQLVHSPMGEARRDLSTDISIRGGVGYGGGEFGPGRDEVFFASRDGILYKRSFSGGFPKPLTPAYGGIASPVVSPGGKWVMYVHSDGVEDVIALVDSRGCQWPAKLVQGADFYMQPVWSPSEDAIAWVEWDHPNMPWDSTRIKLGMLAGDAPRIHAAQLVAGEHGETASQPQFSPDGRYLSYIINRGEWEVLEVLELATGQRKTWFEGPYDLSTPAWVQGQHTYGWNSSSKGIFLLHNAAGKSELCSVESSGKCRVVPTEPYTWLKQLTVSPTSAEFAVIASSPTLPERVIRWDGQNWRVAGYSEFPTLNQNDLPDPQQVEWDTVQGDTVHGLYSAPANAQYTGVGAPPMIVSIHGGPTSQEVLSFPRDSHYFTSRGYAWLEVNYRGSSGFGKTYRKLLDRNWGKFDVEDAVSGAQAMAARGLADQNRTIIFGGSSGGLTVLLALINFTGVFKAGIALYPVTNLFTLGLETHKFEQHYDKKMVGELPQDADVLRERSPLFQAGQIKDIVALFHGRDDTAVPITQTLELVERLKDNGVPHLLHIYEGEGHGFRKAETLADLYPRIEKFLLEHVLF